MRRGCALLGIVMTLLFVPNALAQNPGTGIGFTAQFTDPGDHFSAGGVGNTCPAGQAAMQGTAYFHGQLSGTDTATGCLYWTPDAQLAALQSNDPGFAFAGSTDDRLIGSLDGCGKGSFTMHQTDLKITSFDPVARTFHLTLKWAVASGSGTGAFRGASGGGTASADGTGSPDFTVTPPTAPFASPNSGTYVGTISCPHHE